MEEQCITISNKFALIELDAAIKGFFIQLLLLSQYGNIELIKKNIIKAIGIDTKTYDKYIIKLVGADLVSITTPLTLHTENILLENDFSKQKKLPTNFRVLGGALQFQKGFTPEGKAGRGRCLESDCHQYGHPVSLCLWPAQGR